MTAIIHHQRKLIADRQAVSTSVPTVCVDTPKIRVSADGVFSMTMVNYNQNCITAALATWVDEAKFEADLNNMKIGDGRKIIWMSLDEIVDKLKTLYPQLDKK